MDGRSHRSPRTPSDCMEAEAMNRLLVVGVDTPAGAGIAQALADCTDVSGISFHGGLALDGIACQSIRRGDAAQLALAIAAGSPDCLIYAGPFSVGNWDLPAHDPTWEDEPAMAACLVAAARSCQARLVAISSDAVLSSPKMFHDENEPTTSTHPAVGVILQCEQIFAAAGALVARSHVFGWGPAATTPGGTVLAGSGPGLIQRIAESLTACLPPPIDGHRYSTPILAADLALLLYRAVERNLTGLYHLSGAERTNTFRLASQLAGILGATLPRSLALQPAPPTDDTGWSRRRSTVAARAGRSGCRCRCWPRACSVLPTRRPTARARPRRPAKNCSPSKPPERASACPTLRGQSLRKLSPSARRQTLRGLSQILRSKTGLSPSGHV